MRWEANPLVQARTLLRILPCWQRAENENVHPSSMIGLWTLEPNSPRWAAVASCVTLA